VHGGATWRIRLNYVRGAMRYIATITVANRLFKVFCAWTVCAGQSDESQRRHGHEGIQSGLYAAARGTLPNRCERCVGLSHVQLHTTQIGCLPDRAVVATHRFRRRRPSKQRRPLKRLATITVATGRIVAAEIILGLYAAARGGPHIGMDAGRSVGRRISIIAAAGPVPGGRWAGPGGGRGSVVVTGPRRRSITQRTNDYRRRSAARSSFLPSSVST